jgi:hypothetical protein
VDQAPLREPNFTPHPEYDDLDDGVQAAITPAQFAWLPDSERLRFVKSIGEPDTFVDS